MKKFAFALMAAVATLFSLGFTSCSDDDDEPSVSNGEIYGMWETDYLDCWEKYDGVLDPDSQFKGEFYDWRFYFGKDGTYKFYLKSGSEWELEESAVWSSLSGNKIIISYEDGEKSAEISIKTLSSKKLEMEVRQKYYDEDDGDVESYGYILLHKVN